MNNDLPQPLPERIRDISRRLADDLRRERGR